MKTIFAGSHPSSVSAVWNGKVPAGATYEGNLYNIWKQGQVHAAWYPDGQLNKVRTQKEFDDLYNNAKDGQIVMIAQTPRYSKHTFCCAL